MTEFRITKFDRHDGGDTFTANVTADGQTVRVDNTLGSRTHTTDPAADPTSRRVPRREVRSMIARKLQERLRAFLRGEAADENEATPLPHVNGNGRGDIDAEAIAQRMAAAAAKAVADR